MNSLDLTFTKDPIWIKEREAIWKSWSPGLEREMNLKSLNVYKKYFFTGLLEEGDELYDSAIFECHPLQSEEAWDYILSNIVRKSSVFEDLVKGTLQDRSNEKLFPHMAPYELERWDYFFDEVFNTVVKSRVPVGENQEVSEVELDPVKVFCLISSGIMGAIERGSGGDNPKWFERSSYYWSLFPMLKDCFFEAERRSPEAKSIRYISRLFATTHIHDQKIPYVDSNGARSDFLKEMEEEVEGMYSSLCSGIQKLWDEAKSQKKLENN
ncbi:hypothetical protein A3759_17205 [Thalassolituus sp. HI0120]|nr:hypothetical protein A3759_17205 [Thalassolituus sp. HI0120]